MSVITVFPFGSALYNKGEGHDSVKTVRISCGICLRSENVYYESVHSISPPQSTVTPLNRY
jgi:hypothetical protein